MFVVVATFSIKPGHEQAFFDRVRQQAADSLAREPDCHQFDVCHPAGDRSTVLLYEIYSDEAAFKTHLASSHFADFDARVGPWVAGKKVETWVRAEPAGQ